MVILSVVVSVSSKPYRQSYHIHVDEIAAEVFQEINHCLNGPLAMEDTVLSVRCTKARSIKKEGQLVIHKLNKGILPGQC